MCLNDLIHHAQEESLQPYLCRTDKSKTRKDFMMEKFKELLADEPEKQKADMLAMLEAMSNLDLLSEKKKLCHCGVEGKLCIDPYILELDGEESERVLCEECYDQALMDI